MVRLLRRPCGEDKVCETTDVTLDNFKCIAGTYRDGDDCKPCKHGMECETQGVTLKNVRLEHDKWRTSENSDEIETCPLENACRSKNETQARRRLDESQDDDYDAGENLCAPGHHGPLCAVCKDNHYRSGNECKKCSGGSAVLNVILICGAFLAFIVLAAASIFFKDNLLDICLTCQGDAIEKKEKAEATWRVVKTAIKQMLGMWSVVSNTPWILDVKYPKIFDECLAFLSKVFSFDWTIAADCVFERIGFMDQLLIDTLGPLILCAVIILIGYLASSVSKKKSRITADLVLFIIFLSYTTASITIFRGIRQCHKFDEAYNGSDKYMKDDYGTSCRSNRHDFIRAYAWIMLFVWPIGVPLLTFVFLWRHRETLNPDVQVEPKLRALGSRADGAQEKFVGSCTDVSLRRSGLALVGRGSDAYAPLDKLQNEITDAKIKERERRIEEMEDDRRFFERPELFAFMYDNYEPEYWWFECFDYIRRLLLTGILVVLDSGTAAQGLFGVLVALAGTQIYSWTRPFPDNAGDRLAEAAQWVTFFTFLAALMILLNVEADSAFHRKVFGVLLITITFIPLLIGFCVQVYEQRDNLSECWAQCWHGKTKVDEPKVKAEILDSPKSPHDPRAPPYDEERPAVITN